MPSTEPKVYVDATGRCLGIFVGFKQPDDLLLDRDGAAILFDANGVPSDVGEPIVVRIGDEFDNAPAGAVEVPTAPADGRDTWDGSKWIPYIDPPAPLDPAAFMRVAIAKGLVTEAEIRAQMAKQQGA